MSDTDKSPDSEDVPGVAAGVLFRAGGKILFLQRGSGGDYPLTWALPGGHLKQGESALDAAFREAHEETGFAPTQEHKDGAQHVGTATVEGTTFTTYLVDLGAAFVPQLSDESIAFAWESPENAPRPLHPGVAQTLNNAPFVPDEAGGKAHNELDIARMIRAGEMKSPQHYQNMLLYAIRISGTGVSYRSKSGAKDKNGNDIPEWTYRDPKYYCNQEFVERCNGLPVILEHPAKATLNSEEFRARSVGTIMLPYIQGDEVWGIARIYDIDAIALIIAEEINSTSPTVVLAPDDLNSTVTLSDGNKLLIEGEPILVDHVALVPYGVWDKGGEPTGILNNNPEVLEMNDDEKAKADAEAEIKAKADAEEKAKADAFTKLADSVEGLCKRMDSLESGNKPAPELKTAADEDEAKKKADAEEEEKAKKADAAWRADMERRLAPLTDEDFAKIAEVQARAERVANAFADSAPRPMAGEHPNAYRLRCVRKFQQHSKQWKDVPAEALSAVLDVAEGQVFADAMAIAGAPETVTPGMLHPRTTRSPSGHTIVTYTGDIGVFTSQFKQPIVSKVVNINKGAQQ